MPVVLDLFAQEIDAPCEFSEEPAFFLRDLNSKVSLGKLLRNVIQPAEGDDDVPPDIDTHSITAKT